MKIDLSTKTDKQLQTLLENHLKKGASDRPLYREALNELDRRSASFKFERSRQIIEQAARDRRFVSYKALADESGIDWNRAYRLIGAHLWELVCWGHSFRMPMLSAIVVSIPHLGDGKMEEGTLDGFIRAAHLLGYPIHESASFEVKLGFLQEQQSELFKWFEEPRG